MSSSHRTSSATAAALASASLALLGALLAPPAAATSAPPAPSTSVPAAAPAPDTSAPAAPAPSAPAAGGSAPTADAEAPAATTLVVRPGDTLTALARRIGTPGGWPALYAANRDVVGASPDRLVPGTVLVLPPAASAEAPVEAPVEPAPAGAAPTTTYLVEPGDSLRRIAERTGAPGGWPALYAATRAAVGADPDELAVGTQLVLPAAAVSSSGGAATAAPAPAPSSPQGGPGAGAPGSGSGPSPSPSAPPAEPSPAPSAAEDAPRAAGLPSWVVWPMVVVAGLGLGALLGDPLLALLRRSRTRQLTVPAPAEQDHVAAAGAAAAVLADSPAAPGASVARVARVVPLRSVPLQRPSVHVRGYGSLLVSYSAADDLVLVLAPAGQDAGEVLHLARVVLPDEDFRAVEDELPSALLAEERRRASRLGA